MGDESLAQGRQLRVAALGGEGRERLGGRVRRAGRQRRPGGGGARDEPLEIKRAARLRSGARQAVAAERLHADGRADDVAVDVDVAGGDARGDERDRRVDARMDAAGQRVAGGVERVDQRRQRLALEPQHMQRRAEHFAAEVGDRADLDQRRRDEEAARARLAERRRGDREAARAHRLDMGEDLVARFGADHRPDVGGEAVGRADFEFGHRRLHHRDHAVGDVVLQAQHAQSRAALAGRIEGGGERVGDHLLGQRRGIDDQRVLAAGLGDQRDRRPSGRSRPASAAAISLATSVEPVNIAPPTPAWAVSIAPTAPSPATRISASSGTPASCISRTAAAATSGVSSAGLAMTALPAASAAAIWPVKIATGKFHGLMQTIVPSGGWVALAKSPPATGRRNSAGSRSPRARRRARWAASCPLRDRSARRARRPCLIARRGGGEDRRAFGRRARRPGRAALRRRGESALDVVARSASTTSPTTSAESAGLRIGRAAPVAPPARHSVSRALGEPFRERGEPRLVAEVEPGGIGRAGA